MGFIFSSIFTLIAAVIGIVFGLVGLLIGALLSFSELPFAGPFLILMVILGLIFWQPLLWLVLIVGIFYLYRINKKKRYIKIDRR